MPLTSKQKLFVVPGSILIFILFCFFVTQQEDTNRQAQQQANTQQRARFAELIQQHRFAVGMTADQVRESIGPPSRINRTVGRNYTSEQWIYSETYLYLDNGVLRSFQDSR